MSGCPKSVDGIYSCYGRDRPFTRHIPLMQNNIGLALALIALVIGGGAGYALGVNQQPPSVPITHIVNTGSSNTEGMADVMSAMTGSLAGKTGDEFDAAFLSEMTFHHQGAVEMAQLALRNAKHPEIRAMAQNIIGAQTTEIQQMQNWQTSWYGGQI